MDYKPIPHDDERSQVTDHHHDIPFGPKKKGVIFMAVLIAVTTATLVFVLALLFLFKLQRHQSCAVQDEGWNHSARYGQIRSRMSLDHEYDYLWDDFLIEGFGVVSTTESAADNEDSFAGISMYVDKDSREASL
jgi:hypothetical protein